MKENYTISHGKIRYCSCVQSEGTKGRQIDSWLRWGSLIKCNWKNTFCCFIFFFLPLQIYVNNRPQILSDEKTKSCIILPPPGRQCPPTYTGHSSVGITWAQTGEKLGRSLATSRGDRGCQGAAAGSGLTPSRARVHPAPSPCDVGHRCVPLHGTDGKGMLLVIPICL